MPFGPSSVLVPSSDARIPSSFLLLVVMPGAPFVASLLLVAMPFAQADAKVFDRLTGPEILGVLSQAVTGHFATLKVSVCDTSLEISGTEATSWHHAFSDR